jgi:hypothetical protein
MISGELDDQKRRRLGRCFLGCDVLVLDGDACVSFPCGLAWGDDRFVHAVGLVCRMVGHPQSLAALVRYGHETTLTAHGKSCECPK